jgi:hypothetical protein
MAQVISTRRYYRNTRVNIVPPRRTILKYLTGRALSSLAATVCWAKFHTGISMCLCYAPS